MSFFQWLRQLLARLRGQQFPDPDPDPDPVPDPDPDPDPDPVPDPDPDPDPVPDPDPDPDPVPDPDPDPDPVPDPDPDPDPDPVPDPDPDPDPVPDPDPDPDPDPVPDPDPDPGPVPDPGPLVRREVGALGSDAERWDPIMEHYARAVATMQSRPATDPTSWDAQAAIHGDACQHANWHFLPWHRMYLFRFEAIVREAVIANGGPADWALPYWDYEHNATMPWVFRQDTLDDGTANPLQIPGRNARMADGNQLSPGETNWTQARNASIFAAATPMQVAISFAGPPTGAAFFGRGFGALEQQPHNGIHVAVGGLMGQVPTAGLDPLFWLHHCNIDRLWEVWNREGGANTESTDWLNQNFDFFDVNGGPVTDQNRNVQDIEGSLNYTYEGLPPAADGMVSGSESGDTAVPAEMIGANADGVSLRTGTSSIEVQLDVPVGPSLTSGDASDGPSRVYLVLDNVRGDAAPTVNYDVILDMGTPDDDADDFVIGVASFFGLVEAADVNNEEAPHGLTLTYDITAVVAQLQSLGRWDDERVKVSFRAIEAIDTPEVTVGNVRIFVE